MPLGETLREFGVKISLAFDKKKVDEAKAKIDSLSSQLQHFSFGVAAAAAAIFEFANLSSSNSRDLQQNADLLGINVERLQELEYAAKVAAGVSRGELVGALEAVSDTMDRARHGDVMASEGLLRLAQSGVGVDKMLKMLQDKSVTSEQVMVALSESFKNIKDPIAAARLATEAFGGAGAKLLPLLKQGPEGFAKFSKEARALGLVLGKNTVDAGAAMDREFTKIGLVLKNVSYTIGFEILKYLRPLIYEFEHFIVANKKLIAVNIAKFMQVAAGFVIEFFHAAVKLGQFIGVLIEKLGGVENATRLVIGAFVAFKALMFLSTVVSLISSVVSLTTAFFAAAPAILAAGSAVLTVLGPFALIYAAVAAAVVVIHDLWKIATGGSLEDTWIGQLIIGVSKLVSSLGIVKDFLDLKDKFKAGASEMWDKASSIFGDNAASANSLVTANAVANPGMSTNSDVSQQFNLSTTNNIGVPPGTSAGQAANMIARSTNDSHAQMMIKAKNDATRGRQY